MKRSLTFAVTALFFLAAAPACRAFSEISSVTPLSLAVSLRTDGSRTLSMRVAGAKAGNFEQVIDPEKAAKKCVEYFFTCLSLPDDRFWVNLNPDDPYSIADGELSRTDFGKILLAADLRLKKDASELTSPRTHTGREYWERLYRKADELGLSQSIPVLNRIWIAPGEVALDQANGGVTIVKSGLKVFFEPLDSSASSDPRMKELGEYARSLSQRIIVPLLEDKVNRNYAYWELRQLFRVAVLARWYKQSSGERLPKENLAALESQYSYGSDDIYADYLYSLKKGEYSFTEKGRRKIDLFLHLITRSYVSGGIDWRQISWRKGRQGKNAEEGTLHYSCSFPLNKGAFGLSMAKQDFQVSFPWSGLSPELFDRLPPPVILGKRNVEEGFSWKNFLNSL